MEGGRDGERSGGKEGGKEWGEGLCVWLPCSCIFGCLLDVPRPEMESAPVPAGRCSDLPSRLPGPQESLSQPQGSPRRRAVGAPGWAVRRGVPHEGGGQRWRRAAVARSLALNALPGKAARERAASHLPARLPRSRALSRFGSPGPGGRGRAGRGARTAVLREPLNT